MSGDDIVRFLSVEKTFDGGIMAVAGLNLDIRRAEFLTLLGPSGSGNPTTLMMLAGFETPSAGDIYLEGRLINRTPAYRRNIGVVFQNYALFPHLSIWDNIAYPLRARRLPRDEIGARVNNALAIQWRINKRECVWQHVFRDLTQARHEIACPNTLVQHRAPASALGYRALDQTQ
jgi:ABC-type Fe3+/spermidine/putrescine transport system ATPase subunit